MIPITMVKPDPASRRLIEEVLDSGRLAQGALVERFEALVASMCGTRHAVAVSNGTVSLVAALQAAGVGPGDEVITSAYTYTATASVIAHVGATIVLSDVGKGSYEMDYERLAEKITPRTKAIIPVDIGGKMADYQRIYAILEEKKQLFCPANALQSRFGRVL